MGYKKSALKEPKANKYDMSGGFSSEEIDAVSKDILASVENEKNVEMFVLDFGTFQLEFKLLRPLTVLASELKKKKKKFYILSNEPKISQMLVSEGLSGVIRAISSIEEVGPQTAAATPPAAKKATIDVNFLNPFVEGVIEVLKVQCQLDCTPGKVYLKGTSPNELRADIAGVIGISSPSFAGSISVCFPEKTFLHIMSKMFGEEMKEITKDLEDGAGEVLNMIFGHAKRILNQKGHAFEKALPTVVRGNGLSMNHIGSQEAIVLPFQVDSLAFHMEICTENK